MLGSQLLAIFIGHDRNSEAKADAALNQAFEVFFLGMKHVYN